MVSQFYNVQYMLGRYRKFFSLYYFCLSVCLNRYVRVRTDLKNIIESVSYVECTKKSVIFISGQSFYSTIRNK